VLYNRYVTATIRAAVQCRYLGRTVLIALRTSLSLLPGSYKSKGMVGAACSSEHPQTL
jgi:hypothetical protein